jgi:hypothetical protein
MNRFHALILLLPIVSLTLACGSSNRRLQSVSMTRTANGQRTEFVATGNFSSSPTTVTSIPVEWSVQLMAPPPRQYTLTTQPFLFDCTASGPFPIVAYAPGSKRSTQRVVVKRKDDSGVYGNHLPARKRLFRCTQNRLA